jgi:putative oxidoreductase
MKSYPEILKWGTSHHPEWLVFIRVLLGILLFAKGIDFIRDTSHLEAILNQNGFDTKFPLVPFIISCAHLIGGVFIIIGLFTRPVVVLQLVIVAGALWLNQSGSEMIFAAFIFVLLLVFLLEGSGPVSMDHYFFPGPSVNHK